MLRPFFKRSTLWLLAALAAAFAIHVLVALLAPPETVKRKIDFNSVHWYATRASAAYGSAESIRRDFPNVTHIGELPTVDIRYFVETFPARKLVSVSVRGTANVANLKEDMEYSKANNTRLGIYVHKGFQDSTDALYQDLLPHLPDDYKVRVTGHSLGAAVSSLLMLYLEKDGYELDRSINFGQPKFTNREGAEAYADLPLLRVVDKNDLVPLLPAETLGSLAHGEFFHLGEEVILLDSEYYVFLSRHAATHEITQSFWDNLGDLSLDDHRIANYLSHIEPKLASAVQVDFNNREKYIKRH